MVTAAAINTQNVHLVPSVLVIGAVLIPVTFVVYLSSGCAGSRSSCPPSRSRSPRVALWASPPLP